MNCNYCGAEPALACESCHKTFCNSHASPIDQRHCSECVSYANTFVKAEPLVSDEGEKLNGRHLLLSGEAWMRQTEEIDTLTDVQLDAKIGALQAAVREAEQILDTKRILLSMHENNKASRWTRKTTRLRLLDRLHRQHEAATGAPPVKPKHSDEKVKAVDDLMKAFKAMGVGKEQAAEILQRMAKGGIK